MIINMCTHIHVPSLLMHNTMTKRKQSLDSSVVEHLPNVLVVCVQFPVIHTETHRHTHTQTHCTYRHTVHTDTLYIQTHAQIEKRTRYTHTHTHTHTHTPESPSLSNHWLLFLSPPVSAPQQRCLLSLFLLYCGELYPRCWFPVDLGSAPPWHCVHRLLTYRSLLSPKA